MIRYYLCDKYAISEIKDYRTSTGNKRLKR